MSCNHHSDIILILIIKIMKIGRFVILKSISITREFGLTHLIFFWVSAFPYCRVVLTKHLSPHTSVDILQMSSPKLSWKHPPFCVWKSTLSWWSRKSHSAGPRNNSFIISLRNLKYKRSLKFVVWKTSQHYKPLRLQHRDQFIHVIWLHRARKQCTSLQPFMNFLVNVMSFLRNKTSHHQPGRGVLDQM